MEYMTQRRLLFGFGSGYMTQTFGLKINTIGLGQADSRLVLPYAHHHCVVPDFPLGHSEPPLHTTQATM